MNTKLYTFPRLGDIGCQCPKCKSFDVKASLVPGFPDDTQIYDNRTCNKCAHVGNKYEFMTQSLPTKTEETKVLELTPGTFIKMARPAGKIAQLQELTNGMIRGKVLLSYYGGDFEHLAPDAVVTTYIID